MSETARHVAMSLPAAAPAPGRPNTRGAPEPGTSLVREQQPRRRGPGWTWFGWLLALALALLAQSTRAQLEIQQRLLTGSRELEQLVAAAKETTAALNEQMLAVSDLATATAQMDAQLVQVADRNRSIQRELAALEVTVGAILQSVSDMGDEAATSRQLLQQIAAESAALHRVLLESRAVSADIRGHLTSLADSQEAINADLTEMVAKTRFLDRFSGEE